MPIKVLPVGSQGLKASKLGYGAMGLTAFYGAPIEDDAAIGNVSRIKCHAINPQYSFSRFYNIVLSLLHDFKFYLFSP